MGKFLQRLISKTSQEKIVSLLLVLSFGVNSFSSQVVSRLERSEDPKEKDEDLSQEKETIKIEDFLKGGYLLYDGDTFFSLDPIFTLPKRETIRKNKKTQVILTAYSSSFTECDGNPFRTASGTRVRDGIVATNFLPFGTKIKIPDLFGEKIFVVEDRMAKRYWSRVDVWMSDYKTAIKFGKQYSKIEVLN